MSLDRQTGPHDDRLSLLPPVVGVEDAWPAGAWPSHTHARHQQIFASKGVIHVEMAESTLVLPTSRALWIGAGVPHAVSLKRPGEMVVLYVEPAAYPLTRHSAVVDVSPLVRELIRACAIGYVDYATDSPSARLAQVLLDQVKNLSDVPTELPFPTDRRARRIAELLSADASNRESIEQLGAHVGASARTLMRLFLDETGLSFGAWRLRQRLIASIELLAYGNSVTAVAAEVGYESVSSYVAAFRSMFGKTPARYFE